MTADRLIGLNELVKANEDVRQFPSTAEFMQIVNSLHDAAHGVDVSQDEANHATQISTRFLADIRNYRVAR